MPTPAMTVSALGISGSPTPGSRSRRLVERALAHLAERGVPTDLLDLAVLPAEALLARTRDPAVDAALAQATTARILILGTPTYRATYAGQLKAFFDLLPRDALRGSAVGFIATGSSEIHTLALDHGLRPLVASLGGLSASRGLFVTDLRLPSGASIPDDLDRELAALAAELHILAGVPWEGAGAENG